MQGIESTGYCGLCYENCFFHKDEFADLAKELRKKIGKAKLNKNLFGVCKVCKRIQKITLHASILGVMVRMHCKR